MGSIDDAARPKQGEIWLTAFGAAKVGEPGKTRPAVVLSADGQSVGSVYDLVVVAPLTSTLSPSEVRPQVAASSESGLAVDSVVVVRALRGVSATRLAKCIGRVDITTLMDIRVVLETVLDLP
ncbi:MAG: type II toxin-antitoxin system PemK/MazF family toxin [Propionibacteriaceae bacterium]|jgi:mRNA interferase MazF|nr:type II toxin-antitoxin system PemK/MazF family toxin [Propionibacteriaceae bacterium]